MVDYGILIEHCAVEVQFTAHFFRTRIKSFIATISAAQYMPYVATIVLHAAS